MQDNSDNKISLFTIFTTTFIDYLGYWIIIPILAPLFLSGTAVFPQSISFEFRAIILGLLVASYPIAQFFGAPILGAWSDRVGRKKALIVSLFGTFIGYLIFGIGIVTSNLFLLFASRVIDGFTGGNVSVITSAVADISSKKDKARNFSWITFAFGLGYAFGPFVGGELTNSSLVSWFNFATPFWFAATLTLFNILLVIVRFRETLQNKKLTKLSLATGITNVHKVFTLKSIRTMFLVIFLFTFGFTFYSTFIQVFLVEKFSYTAADVGTFFGYAGIWVALVQILVARPVSRRIKPHKVLLFSLLLLSLVFPIMVFPNQAFYLYLIIPFAAIFNGLSIPNSTAIISNLADKESQGEIIGLNQSVQALALAIPPIIAGFSVSINISLPLIFAGIIIFLSWAVFLIFFLQNRKSFSKVSKTSKNTKTNSPFVFLKIKRRLGRASAHGKKP